MRISEWRCEWGRGWRWWKDGFGDEGWDGFADEEAAEFGVFGLCLGGRHVDWGVFDWCDVGGYVGGLLLVRGVLFGGWVVPLWCRCFDGELGFRRNSVWRVSLGSVTRSSSCIRRRHIENHRFSLRFHGRERYTREARRWRIVHHRLSLGLAGWERHTGRIGDIGHDGFGHDIAERRVARLTGLLGREGFSGCSSTVLHWVKAVMGLVASLLVATSELRC